MASNIADVQITSCSDPLFELMRNQAIWEARRRAGNRIRPASTPAKTRRVFPRTRRAVPTPEPLAAYAQCGCHQCKQCKENARWDQLFTRMVGDWRLDERGVFGSTLARVEL